MVHPWPSGVEFAEARFGQAGCAGESQGPRTVNASRRADVDKPSWSFRDIPVSPIAVLVSVLVETFE